MEGYKNLATYILRTIIDDLTIIFLKKYISKKSRTYDQMEQAARSGKQNIAESYPNTPKLPNNQEEAANMLLTFCQMETFLLKRQIESLKRKFTKEGGFRENLLRKV